MAGMEKNLDREEMLALIGGAVKGDGFRRATFAGATRGYSCEWVRVVIRPVELRGDRHFQFAYQGAKKAVTKNFSPDELDAPLDELVGYGFAGVHITTNAEELDVRTSRKGRVHVGRHKPKSPTELSEPEAHNRVKDVPLPEGRADALLEVMGVSTPDGRVKPTMRAKFTQINEFLKQLQHVFGDAKLADLGRELRILDCGCGSSYLTLAAHHYLNDVLGVPARILGVDVNEEVIRKSVERAERLGASNLEFECRRIGTADVPADIVIALHACDTATDDAIAQAVRSGARLFLGVPCCHHDLNKVISATGPAEVLRPVLRHGIMAQRAADLVTDAFRALALRITGYRTDVVEFVSTEHTARNLMIRAVRGASAAHAGEAEHVAEYIELKRFWRVTPYIEKVLGEPFQQLVRASTL
ncbi:SAM-dependent methyltransferase [Gemmata sp. JC673]|uniref:SAM-dependent methyltransferase n=1 Tax=Gemmata algarum TaxID=2975278 RepID=A0ABU5F914_9BACT|nr:SAM-dependent methyltransferase [Gemmata algarum]MDY3562888.1 SAM-dependent methyltransferase [Gemmata algarum]